MLLTNPVPHPDNGAPNFAVDALCCIGVCIYTETDRIPGHKLFCRMSHCQMGMAIRHFSVGWQGIRRDDGIIVDVSGSCRFDGFG